MHIPPLLCQIVAQFEGKRQQKDAFMDEKVLLSRFGCIRTRECVRIKVRLAQALAGGAHPRRI
jgi:hypothetical protein